MIWLLYSVTRCFVGLTQCFSKGTWEPPLIFRAALLGFGDDLRVYMGKRRGKEKGRLKKIEMGAGGRAFVLLGLRNNGLNGL